MSAAVLPVIPKRFIDFNTLATGGQAELILADRISVVHWRELTLKLRIHNHTMTGTNQITVLAYAQSWTADDPGVQFIGAATTSPAIVANTPSPGMLSVTLPMIGSNAIANLVRVTAIGNRSGAGSMQANLSIEFSTKDA